MTDDKILKPENYPWMADEIRAGRVPKFALIALRDMNPDFAAYFDSQPPRPSAPAGALPVPVDETCRVA